MSKYSEAIRAEYLDWYLNDPRPISVLNADFAAKHRVGKCRLHQIATTAGITVDMRNRNLHSTQIRKARELLAEGISVKAAARAVGLSNTTLRKWLGDEGYRFASGSHGGLLEIKREKQQAAVAAPKLGVSFQQLSEQLGISSSTLRGWHHAYMNGTLDITFTAEESGKVGRGKRICWDERALIAFLLDKGNSPSEIARQLGRSQSTIHREIRRNSNPDGRYVAQHAQQQACRNLRRPRKSKLETNLILRKIVINGLNAWWSPQQISGLLARLSNKREDAYVSHETIYQALYIQGKGALRHELTVEKALRSGRTGRKPQSKLPRRANRSWIGPDYHISKRPANAQDRAVPGHWEGDLVIGKAGKSALITCVERSTRFTLIRKLDVHDAASTTDRLIEMFSGLMRDVTKTLTWDQGSEMADVERFSLARAIPVYFCDPHSPWQRPTNENTNGLVRDFLPKGSDFTDLTDEQIQNIQDLLNDRPRQVLGFYSPREKMMELFK